MSRLDDMDNFNRLKEEASKAWEELRNSPEWKNLKAAGAQGNKKAMNEADAMLRKSAAYVNYQQKKDALLTEYPKDGLEYVLDMAAKSQIDDMRETLGESLQKPRVDLEMLWRGGYNKIAQLEKQTLEQFKLERDIQKQK